MKSQICLRWNCASGEAATARITSARTWLRTGSDEDSSWSYPQAFNPTKKENKVSLTSSVILLPADSATSPGRAAAGVAGAAACCATANEEGKTDNKMSAKNNRRKASGPRNSLLNLRKGMLNFTAGTSHPANSLRTNQPPSSACSNRNHLR